MQPRLLPIAVCAALSLSACDGDDPAADAGTDAGVMTEDAGSTDAGFDAGSVLDAGFDAGLDAGPPDGGPSTTTFPARDHRCAAGATPPCPTDEPVRSDAERTVEVPREMAPGTYTFVVRTWSMPEPSFAGTAAGFNHDALDSGNGSTASDATCEEFSQDYGSLRDPGHVGVDNAMASLLPTIEGLMDEATCPGMVLDGCLDASFARNIADGSFLLLVELTGVESLVHDDSIQVALYVGAIPSGAPPALESDGRLSPDQAFDTVAMLAPPTEGDLFEGRLRVRWPGTVMLPGPSGLLLPLELDAPELRSTIGAGGLELGVVGATTSVDFLVAQAEAAMPGIGGTVRSIVGGVADVSPSSDPQVCEQISSGYFFDAVSATRR